MNKDEALIAEKEKIQDIINFNNDIFNQITLKFSQNFYPTTIKDNDLNNLDIENSQKFLSNYSKRQ